MALERLGWQWSAVLIKRRYQGSIVVLNKWHPWRSIDVVIELNELRDRAHLRVSLVSAVFYY
jgi:hypothetical protein